MYNWAEKLFIERADLSIKIMNLRWPHTEKFVDGMINLLKECKSDDWELVIYDVRRGVRMPIIEGKVHLWQCRNCMRVVAATDEMYRTNEEV